MANFSQPSQTISAQGPTSLPLHKLSFCTTAVPGAKMLWTHLFGRTNMFAVFDRLRTIGLGGSISESRILKLTCEADLLERIELDNLLFQVRLDEERIKSQALQDSDRYVILIVKRPMIALRYQLPDGKIRKLQLNFLPESGYDVAVQMFASLGLPIREKTSLAQPALKEFVPSYSQTQYSIPSPSHSQEAQVMHQAPPIPSTAIPGTPSTSRLGPPHQPVQWAPYGSIPPNSAPETYSERPELPTVSVSQMLPPKRTLPFPPKNTKVPPPDPDVTSAPHSQDPTTVEVPAAVTASKKKKSQTTAPRAKKAAAPKRVRARKTTEQNAASQTPHLNETPTNPETVCVPATPEATRSSHNVVSPISLSSPKRPADDFSGTTSSDHAEPHKRNKTGKSGQQPLADDVEPAEFMSRLDTWVRMYHQTLPAPKPPPAPPPPQQPASQLATASDTLALFAGQPKEERMAAIDEMICECLGDPSFVQLVQDVEDSWKRIGLGF